MEFMEAGDSPEAYTQLGVRCGSGILRVGGWRFGHPGIRAPELFAGGGGGDEGVGDLEETIAIDLYSDFNYWKIWLLGSWRISPKFSLDFLANYEPENHTENTDDSAIGFASLHLIWRP